MEFDNILILATDKKMPEKLPEVCRVALIDLPPTEPQDPPSSQSGSTQSVVPTSSSKHKDEDAASMVQATKKR